MLPSNGERTSSVSPERAAARCPPISNWVFLNSASSVDSVDSLDSLDRVESRDA